MKKILQFAKRKTKKNFLRKMFLGAAGLLLPFSTSACSDQGDIRYQPLDFAETTEGFPAPKNWRELYPHGSAGKLEGTIVVISIFASDLNGIWDMNDHDDRTKQDLIYRNLKIACDYLTTESARYAKDVTFVWDWKDHPELYYEVGIDAALAKLQTDFESIEPLTWETIEKNIDSEDIRRTFGADSMIYMVYIDSPADNKAHNLSGRFRDNMSYPYEVSYIQTIFRNKKTPPAVYAHEMLHAFGAPDLYLPDNTDDYPFDYDITTEYAREINDNNLNDIMRITWNVDTHKYEYNKISPQITDITAYYVGLTDESETVKKWGFAPSQHDE